MEYEVVFTVRARRDLLAARRWLSQPGSGLRVRLRIARITRAIAELQFTPFRWPVGRHNGARERHVDGYRIVYKIDEAGLEAHILRIFGPYQDQSSL